MTIPEALPVFRRSVLFARLAKRKAGTMTLSELHVRVLELAREKAKLDDVPPVLRDALEDLKTADLVVVKAGNMRDPKRLHLTSQGVRIWLEITAGDERPPKDGLAETSASEAAPTLPTTPQYVTLDKAAAIVSRSKRTLEKLFCRKENPLPDPAIRGTGGKPSEWIWSKLRPWLEQEYGRHLPERFPSRDP
jgi:hypothetical protein